MPSFNRIWGWLGNNTITRIVETKSGVISSWCPCGRSDWLWEYSFPLWPFTAIFSVNPMPSQQKNFLSLDSPPSCYLSILIQFLRTCQSPLWLCCLIIVVVYLSRRIESIIADNWGNQFCRSLCRYIKYGILNQNGDGPWPSLPLGNLAAICTIQ